MIGNLALHQSIGPLLDTEVFMKDLIERRSPLGPPSMVLKTKTLPQDHPQFESPDPDLALRAIYPPTEMMTRPLLSGDLPQFKSLGPYLPTLDLIMTLLLSRSHRAPPLDLEATDLPGIFTTTPLP
jgi:hypothetical protein